jgi:hypothetical protein
MKPKMQSAKTKKNLARKTPCVGLTPKSETKEGVPIFSEWRISMKRGYRRLTAAEKRAAVARMAVCDHDKLAAELGICQRVLYVWRAREVRLEKAARAEASRERALEQENRKLKEALATRVLEVDFLQGVLRRIEARRRPISGCGETASTSKCK